MRRANGRQYKDIEVVVRVAKCGHSLRVNNHHPDRFSKNKSRENGKCVKKLSCPKNCSPPSHPIPLSEFSSISFFFPPIRQLSESIFHCDEWRREKEVGSRGEGGRKSLLHHTFETAGKRSSSTTRKSSHTLGAIAGLPLLFSRSLLPAPE